MAWFIEALSAADGLAFISRRVQAEPVEVFFVGAPQFYPLPVRHIATAQWAMRGAFQEGVRDLTARVGEDGLRPEIDFPTLEKAIEFVRRLFNTLGGDTTPMLSTPLTPLPLSPAGLNAIKALIENLAEADDRSPIAESARIVMMSEAFKQLLRAFFVAALARMPAANDTDPGPDEDRTAMVVLLEKSGLWEDPAHLFKEWRVARDAINGAALLKRPQGSFSGSAASVQLRLLSGLLLRIPAPVALPAPYLRGLPTLGHHLAAAASDRGYLKLLDGEALLLPLIATSLLAAAATIDLAPASEKYFTSLTIKASRWIADSVADRSLAEVPGAEQLISRTMIEIAKRNEAHFAALDAEAEAELEAEAKVEAARSRHVAKQEQAKRPQREAEAQRESERQAAHEAEQARRRAEAQEQEEKARAQQAQAARAKMTIKASR